TASNPASVIVTMRRFNLSSSLSRSTARSARQLDHGGAKVRAAEAAGERDHPMGEEAVKAVVGALTVIRRVEPLRARQSWQVVPRHDELRESQQREIRSGTASWIGD